MGSCRVTDAFIQALPKVELHLHLEGTLEPELMVALAERNEIRLPHGSLDALRAAYRFDDLQSFLDLYYQGTSVLCREEDFFDLTTSYLDRARAMNIRHAEVFFDPQSHTRRGVPFEVAVTGIHRALAHAEDAHGLTSRLIMCFMRDLGPEAAVVTLDHARPYGEWIDGVGLDSTERDYPPAPFADVYAAARSLGWHAVAHAGEEGPPAYIRDALDLLRVERIDHGVRCLEDPDLVARLARDRVPLTVCPLSNVHLQVYPTIEAHDLRRLLEAGLCVTVNSDDPAYFGGYLTENLLAVRDGLGLGPDEIETLARNSYEAAFIADERRAALAEELDEALASL